MIGDITLTITFDRGDCKDYVYIKTFSITYETLVHRVKQDKRNLLILITEEYSIHEKNIIQAKRFCPHCLLGIKL